MTRLTGIDAVKYLMAYCVVAIHFRANYIEAGYDSFAYPLWLDWLIRLAVPFFFMTTGYLLQRKLQGIESARDRRKFMFERCRKVLRMWGLWNLIYLPLVAYYFVYFDYTVVDAVKLYVNMLTLYGGIYCAFPLWYLYSLIFITLTVGLLQGVKGYRLVLFLVFAASIILRWLNTEPESMLLRLNNRLIGYAYGGGLAFIAGMLVFSMQGGLRTLLSCLLLLLSLCMRCYGELPFIPQIGAVGLFGLSLVLSSHMGNLRLTGLRRQSMWIYFTHMIVIAFYFKIFEVQAFIPNAWVNFALVEGGAGLLGYILYRVEQKPYGHLLSNLI